MRGDVGDVEMLMTVLCVVSSGLMCLPCSIDVFWVGWGGVGAIHKESFGRDAFFTSWLDTKSQRRDLIDFVVCGVGENGRFDKFL